MVSRQMSWWNTRLPRVELACFLIGKGHRNVPNSVFNLDRMDYWKFSDLVDLSNGLQWLNKNLETHHISCHNKQSKWVLPTGWTTKIKVRVLLLKRELLILQTAIYFETSNIPLSLCWTVKGRAITLLLLWLMTKRCGHQSEVCGLSPWKESKRKVKHTAWKHSAHVQI